MTSKAINAATPKGATRITTLASHERTALQASSGSTEGPGGWATATS